MKKYIAISFVGSLLAYLSMAIAVRDILSPIAAVDAIGYFFGALTMAWYIKNYD